MRREINKNNNYIMNYQYGTGWYACNKEIMSEQ